MPVNDELTVRYHDAEGYWHIGKRLGDQLYRKGYDRVKVKLELKSINEKKGTITYRITDDPRADGGRVAYMAPGVEKNRVRPTL